MYIGIDLGGTNIAAGLVTKDGRIVCTKSTPTEKERPLSEIVADMARLAEEVAADGGVTLHDVEAVGIGSPGTIDKKNGVVVYSNNIVMHDFPLVAELQKHVGLPAFIENDANAAAFGEYHTCLERPDSFVFMTLGTGVGGGIILGGKIWSGFNGAGAEIGHQTLVFGGKRCTCGRRGCLEAYASVSALIGQTGEAAALHPESLMNEWIKTKGRISGRTAFECAAAGDTTAISVRDRYIGYVADGIASIVNVLQPEVVVIGGGISREGDILLAPIKRYLKENDFNKFMKKTDVRTATLFGDAGIVGAAMVAKDAME